MYRADNCLKHFKLVNPRVYRLMIKNYRLLCKYCLMTSAGGNFTFLSRGEDKLNYNPHFLKIFAEFSLANFV